MQKIEEVIAQVIADMESELGSRNEELWLPSVS
jgi:hypothetical protein